MVTDHSPDSNNSASKRLEQIEPCPLSQGVPIIIVAITALVDTTRDRCIEEKNYYKPNMGIYQCFLGSRFIYFQSFLLIISFINIVLFVLTARILRNHWEDAKILNMNKY